MKLREMMEKLDLKLVTQDFEEDREVNGCYIGDLLSWVMSRAQSGDAWITVQTNINIVAVAALTDVACIIVPESIEVDAPTVQKANMQDIVILSSDKNSYELAKLL